MMTQCKRSLNKNVNKHSRRLQFALFFCFGTKLENKYFVMFALFNHSSQGNMIVNFNV